MGVPFKAKLRPYLVAGVALFVVVEIIALSPSSVEQPSAPTAPTPERELIDPPEETLASGIPKGKIPDYSIDQFNYVSTVNGIHQWKLFAERAAMFNKERLVHARMITAHLLDPSGKDTLVTGKEAKYYMNQKDLEIYGDVVTHFPDGFELHSQYLRYKPDTRKILIPSSYPVHGEGLEQDGQRMAFESRGLDFAMAESQIVLPENVTVTMTQSGPEHRFTSIQSDHCVIDRAHQLAHFTMSAARPLDDRFVKIRQPDLFARSRRADLNYGDFSKVLQYLIAYEDVLIKEKGTVGSLRYGTGGQADFDTKRNLIILREFPQVYQDNDTVTGDVIIVHRDTDIVEVDHSNAYSEGDKQPGS